MNVLGIYTGHDSNCCIVRDGVVLADAQEERFARVKHSANVPIHALRYCLDTAGLQSIEDVDVIAVGATHLHPWLRALLGIEPPDGDRRPPVFKPPLYVESKSLRDHRKLEFVEHHLAHAASAHYTRAVADRCLVFTLDGIGDDVSTAVWEASGTRIEPLQKLGREASVGLAYSAVTEGLGWRHGDGEGKTMGFAPYGDAMRCEGRLDPYFPVFNGINVQQPLGLGRAYAWNESGAPHWHFDEATTIRDLAAAFRGEDIAAEAQRRLEESVVAYVRAWIERTGLRRTAFAGGVFLNVKLNQRIWSQLRGELEEQHIFPNPGDAGLALGAALFAYYARHPFVGAPLSSLAWGPGYDSNAIEQIVRERGLAYKRLADPSLRAAELLTAGKIVGWFQGRMESGPRALGHRSILMSPFPAANKDAINARVKFRESFRPFCPSLLWEKRGEYLRDVRDEHFMITSFDVNPAWRDRLGAVVHVDGSVRPQMVRREHHEPYWRLIDAFGQRTGVYAVLNTSMNIKGEPIVNTPSEAIRLFADSGLDALLMEDVLIQKPLTT